jgi:hypothetical protein
MSVNQPPTTSTPAPLTGAHAAIWAALNDQPGETAAALALAAGIGRSTAGKALAALENNGLAHRQTGDITGGRRTADRWHPAPPNHTTNTQTPPLDDTNTSNETGEETADTAPGDGDNTSGTGTNNESLQPQPVPATDTDTDTEADADADAEAGTESEDTHSVSEAQTTDVPQPGEAHPDHAEDNDQDDTSPPADGAQDAASGPDDENAAPDAERPALIAVSGGKQRLAPGALRHMVTDHLRTHPDQTFTATALSRVIGKSSGAIANALVTLAKHGQAKQVTDKPRTYRHIPETTE